MCVFCGVNVHVAGAPAPTSSPAPPDTLIAQCLLCVCALGAGTVDAHCAPLCARLMDTLLRLVPLSVSTEMLVCKHDAINRTLLGMVVPQSNGRRLIDAFTSVCAPPVWLCIVVCVGDIHVCVLWSYVFVCVRMVVLWLAWVCPWQPLSPCLYECVCLCVCSCWAAPPPLTV